MDLLQGSPYLHGLRRVSEIRNLSLSVLKSLQSQMRNDLEEIEKVITIYLIIIKNYTQKTRCNIIKNYVIN